MYNTFITIKIDMIRNASYFRSCINAAFTFIIILMFDVLLLNSAILVPNHSFIIFANIQHYSHQIYNLIFSVLCQHDRLRRGVYCRAPFFKGYKFHGFHRFLDFHKICFTEHYQESYHDTDCTLKRNVDS